MKFKFNRRKKNKVKNKETHQSKTISEESLHMPCDEDGKIVFLNKENTPNWLVQELNNRFRCNKDRGTKCGGLPA